MKTSFILLTASLLLWLSASAALAEAPLPERLIEQALKINPELAAAKQDWLKAEQQPDIVASLDDPVLALSLQNYPVDSLAYDESPMTGNEIRLTQKLPYPGKLASRRAGAVELALSKEESYAEQRLRLARQVAETYNSLLLQNTSIAILENNRQLLTDLARSLETGYASGKNSQLQIIAAQQQQTLLLDQLTVATSQRQSLLNSLQRLIPAELPLTELKQAVLPQQLPQHLSDTDGWQLAVNQRPLLRAYDHLAAQYRHQQQQARLDKKPDVSLWVAYRFRDGGPMDSVQGEDMVSVGLSFNLPVFSAKRKAALGSASYAENQTLAQLENARQQIEFNISEAVRKMELARRQVDLYDQALIPQTRTAWQAALSGYQDSRSSYQEPLQLLLQLQQQQLTRARLQTDYLQNLTGYQAETATLLPQGTQNHEN